MDRLGRSRSPLEVVGRMDSILELRIPVHFLVAVQAGIQRGRKAGTSSRQGLHYRWVDMTRRVQVVAALVERIRKVPCLIEERSSWVVLQQDDPFHFESLSPQSPRPRWVRQMHC